MQMKKLEEILGCKVLCKNGRNIELTEHGEKLAQHARKILKLNDDLFYELNDISSEGEIRLGTSDDYAVMFLSDICNEYMCDNPGVTFNTKCANRGVNIESLNNGKLDIIIVPAMPRENLGIKIRTDRLMWVGRGSGGDELQREENNPLPLAGFPSGCLCREQMIAALEKSEREWSFVYTSESIISLHSVLRNGTAIAVMEEITVPEYLPVLDGKYDLPSLPDIDLVVMQNERTKNALNMNFRDYLIDSVRNFSRVSPI